MSSLRDAAQAALEALEWHYRQGHSNTIGGFRLKIDEKALRELRAALAQQKDPTDPGHDVDVLREHVRHLERRIRELHAQQAEPLNLRDPAVQKRLATQWGYVPAAQAEPVEPVAWRTFDGEGGYDYRTYADNENYAAEWAQRNPRHVGWVEPLYTAPPQRKPLTEEEIYRATGHCGVSKYTAITITRAVERAHGIT